MNKRLTLKLIAACALLAAAAAPFGAGAGPDQAQVGPRLRDLRAVPQVVGVGRRGIQEAHQRQVRDPGVPGLQPGQGKRHQPGPAAGHGGHHPHRRLFAARTFPRLAVSYYPFTFRDADHVIKYAKSDVFKELAEGYKKASGGNTVTALTYYGARHVDQQQAVQELRRDEGPEDARARRAGLHRAAPRLRRQPDADRLRRGLPGAAERHRGRAGKPAAHHRGQEVLRSAEEHHPDRPHRRRAAHHRLRPA